MKHYILAGTMLLAICIGGCGGSLPPHEALNQAVTKSFEATGFNYNTQTRITNLVVPPQKGTEEKAEKHRLNLMAGLEVVRGFSVRADGAIDSKAKKSEVLYDFHYDKDNVEVSIRLPVMMDYNTQTIYVGTSIFTTILEAVYPLPTATRGKLIRINIGDLLKEGAAAKPELSRLIGTDRFSPAGFDQMNGAVKVAVRKAVARLNDAGFSDQPLSGEDRKAGINRRIRMQLGHEDSVSFLLGLADGIAQELLQIEAITREVYDVVHVLADRQQLAGQIEKFPLTMTVDAGIDRAGLVSYLNSRLSVADGEAGYQLGLENVSSFTNYDAPRFTMVPEGGGVVDFKEVLEALAAAAADDQDDENPDDEEDDDVAPENSGSEGVVAT
ncbi:MAG TPA: hypothetical protein VFF53_06405 [Geobacteraceae bacterium]|nr:hypothetical protein [Geobacteraceae bacterium]